MPSMPLQRSWWPWNWCENVKTWCAAAVTGDARTAAASPHGDKTVETRCIAFLFADAEAGENLPKYIIVCDFSCNFAQMADGVACIYAQQIRGSWKCSLRASASSLVAKPASRGRKPDQVAIRMGRLFQKTPSPL